MKSIFSSNVEETYPILLVHRGFLVSETESPPGLMQVKES